MKKILYLLLVALIATSCARGYYAPRNTNQYGVQTQVVLNKANFRIVRHVEVVIDVNNTNLKREDVEKSAYAELLRRANLTGSQALINVVVEEVRRESTNIFRILFGLPKVVQHVAARATVIEFLDDNGKPIQSTDVQGTAPRVHNDSQTVSSSNNVAQQKADDSQANIEQTAVITEPARPTDMASLAKLDVNIYYMVLLYKTNTIDKSQLSEIQQYFDYKDITKRAPKYSVNELQQASVQHDKMFEKFAVKK